MTVGAAPSSSAPLELAARYCQNENAGRSKPPLVKRDFPTLASKLLLLYHAKALKKAWPAKSLALRCLTRMNGPNAKVESLVNYLRDGQ